MFQKDTHPCTCMHVAGPAAYRVNVSAATDCALPASTRFSGIRARARGANEEEAKAKAGFEREGETGVAALGEAAAAAGPAGAGAARAGEESASGLLRQRTRRTLPVASPTHNSEPSELAAATHNSVPGRKTPTRWTSGVVKVHET